MRPGSSGYDAREPAAAVLRQLGVAQIRAATAAMAELQVRCDTGNAACNCNHCAEVSLLWSTSFTAVSLPTDISPTLPCLFGCAPPDDALPIV
jgi:hypothetical protein